MGWGLGNVPHLLNHNHYHHYHHHTHESNGPENRSFLIPSIFYFIFIYISGWKEEGRNWPAMLRKKMRRFARPPSYTGRRGRYVLFVFWNGRDLVQGGNWLRSVSRLPTLRAVTITRINHWAEGGFSFWSWGKALVGAIPPTKSLVKWCGWTSYLSENACSPIKRAFFPSSFWYHHFHPFPSFSNQALN